MSRELKATVENQVLLVQQVLQVPQVNTVLRVRRVHRATQVPLAFQGQMVPQDQKDTMASQEHQEKVVRTEGQDHQDHLVPLVHQDPKGLRATQVSLAHLVQLASQLKEFPAQWVHLEYLAPKATMVSLGLLVHLVHLANQERLCTTMKRACPSSPMRSRCLTKC